MSLRRSSLQIALALAVAGPAARAVPVRSDELAGKNRFIPAEFTLGADEVSVRIDTRSGRPMVPASINGAGPYLFLLDSTANRPRFDLRLVLKAGLTIVEGGDADGPRTADGASPNLLYVRSLSIGPSEFLDFHAVAVSVEAEEGGPAPHHGTLPLSFFSGLLVTLNPDAGMMSLRKAELPSGNGRQIIAYSRSSAPPIVRLTLKDVDLDFAMDTTARAALTFPESLKEKVTAAYRSKPAPLLVGKAKERYEPPMDGAGEFQLGGCVVSFAPFEFKDDFPTIGWKIFRNFNLTFDPMNGRMRLSRPDNAPLLFSFTPKFGLELQKDRGAMVVATVFPGSPIDRSAIKVGTRVLQIEGRPAREYTQESLRALMEKKNSLLFQVESSGFPMMVPVDADGS